ncbi:putative alkyl hydroperoxide reductase/ Thiol specific antioxidant/ Mal allergen [Cardiosporidium cionae]|uniref:Alkyl hydroperoxide reductase/ Thiol specific antioxidant/ Mal allergen n=1 Tax=Cardiosporidium cionae TaxID=476202 RepID=A0A3Q8UBJ0_9APIC|nr:peroxiredoxin 1 [Cardiosporidium cionae]KAF8819942.1 putative alkyl hydroperoxide reductase/ Thiol specific antioxidant/ Mal allergen [Cardiosporidium cionae]|eukprot:KAF8819942.1 putative alkyl hydroperoxide reductase/ Thiol specific antioxidant/ Mal allergen [Cardiosporidium cionae]
MPTSVSQAAPYFHGTALLPDGSFGNIKLTNYLRKKSVLLFFYPFDFTFVCPSEIIAFDRAYEEFQKRDVEVIGCSVDSHHAHAAWSATPIEKGGIGKLQFPLLSDVSHKICADYGVLLPEGMALRGMFLIDKNGILQSSTINNLFLGRSVEEAMRMIDACIHYENYGEVCPANWKKGKKAIIASRDGISTYLKEEYTNGKVAVQ